MSDLAITRQTASLLLHTGDDAGNSLGMSMPFPTTITLHEDITIAGTTHVKNIDQILENVGVALSVEFRQRPWKHPRRMGYQGHAERQARRVRSVRCQRGARALDGRREAARWTRVSKKAVGKMDQASHGGEPR